MLSLECQTVYDLIRQIAGEEEVYKIIEADEIIERLPSGLPLSKVQLSAIIRELKDREYILVKYFTPDEYCLSVIKRIEEPPQSGCRSSKRRGKARRAHSLSKQTDKGQSGKSRKQRRTVRYVPSRLADRQRNRCDSDGARDQISLMIKLIQIRSFDESIEAQNASAG